MGIGTCTNEIMTTGVKMYFKIENIQFDWWHDIGILST